MTNIITATLLWVSVTNWTTVSITRPVYYQSNYITDINEVVKRSDTHNQVGTVRSNLVALLPWKGKVHSIVLEDIPTTNTVPLTRTMISTPGW